MRTLIEVIGKAIWVLVDRSGYGIYHIDKSSKRTIVAVVEPGHNLPDGTVNEDWCEHLVFQDEDGTISHCKEYCAVICPENLDDEPSKVYRFLTDNRCYPEDVYRHFDGLPVIQVAISWGDWKHDHMWCDDLMGYLGYHKIGEQVTEEDGSDCYSSIHNYIKTGE